MHTWDPGPKSSAKVQELLLRLDRTDSLVAQQLATGPEYKGAHVVQTSSQGQSSSSYHQVQSTVGFDDAFAAAHVPLPESFSSFLGAPIGETAGEQPSQAEDEYEYELDSDSEVDFDMSLYDDDGQPIVDEQSGELLVPFDPDREYDANTAIFLTAWAGSYKEVRGQLQATRTGREQKVVKKRVGDKGGSKGRIKVAVKKKFFKPGTKPKRTFPHKRTPFKD